MANTIFQNDYPINPAIGFNGQILGPIEACDIVPAKNVEPTASIAFGRAVVQKIAGATSDLDVLLPAAVTDVVAGILYHQLSYMPAFTTVDLDGNIVVNGELDAVGLVPGTFMAIVRRGKLLVRCDNGCKPQDRLFVRAIAGSGNLPGGLASAADGANMIDCTKQGVWLSSAPPGGFAALSFDINNKP